MDKDNNIIFDEKSESRLYVGNLDLKITEGKPQKRKLKFEEHPESPPFGQHAFVHRRASLIKMFSPFGKIVFEDFLWHTRGPKRGSPRGYAFIQFSTKEEAKRAKEKMHGKLACGRPLVVRLAREKYLMEMANKSSAIESTSKSGNGQLSRCAKIAAIKNKLKAMEEENHDTKRQKQS